MDLCVDVGGTKTFVAVFDDDSITPREVEQFPTQSHRGFEDFLNRMVKISKRLLNGNHPNVWGISTAGAVDEYGNLLWSPNLGWKNLPLKKIVSEIFGDNGVVENDCNAAAYAESWVRQSENLAYVTVSTGIGMGLVLQGKVFRGSHSSAGEIGHTIVEEEGPVCSCGRRGCLQALSSGRGLENLIQSITGEKLSCEEILLRAQNGIEPYLKVALHGAQVLARTLTNIVDALDLQTLVLGGGLTKNEFYVGKVLKYIQQNYYRPPGKVVSLELSKVEPNPGVVGVLIVARETFGGMKDAKGDEAFIG
ncbi:MAG TPA: ROK family protein [Pseudothermotoga sp.]|nr:ROK family protein [Pseudothermotoga sp.]HOK83376.1 ROK family protein [Pseudothermotoga sp.]HPP70201.1 ROK family protein [Pseudothermotoga sp.]